MWRGRKQRCRFVHNVASLITFLPHLVWWPWLTSPRCKNKVMYSGSCRHKRQRWSPCLQNLLFPRTVTCGCRAKLNFTQTSLCCYKFLRDQYPVRCRKLEAGTCCEFRFPSPCHGVVPPHYTSTKIPSCSNTDVADLCNSTTSCRPTVHMLRHWSDIPSALSYIAIRDVPSDVMGTRTQPAGDEWCGRPGRQESYGQQRGQPNEYFKFKK